MASGGRMMRGGRYSCYWGWHLEIVEQLFHNAKIIPTKALPMEINQYLKSGGGRTQSFGKGKSQNHNDE